MRGITNRKTVLEGYENVQAALLDYTLTCYPSVEVSLGQLLFRNTRAAVVLFRHDQLKWSPAKINQSMISIGSILIWCMRLFRLFAFVQCDSDPIKIVFKRHAQSMLCVTNWQIKLFFHFFSFFLFFLALFHSVWIVCCLAAQFVRIQEKFAKLISIIPEIHIMAASGEDHLYLKHCAGSAPTQTLLMEMLHAKRK